MKTFLTTTKKRFLIMMSEEKQNTMLKCVLFTFFVSGFASQPLGSFIPFLRSTYGFSYDLSGVLLSCQSIGNMITVLLTGFLPFMIGRRNTILITSVWMGIAYLIFISGIGTPAVLIAAFLMTGFARGGNSNFANTMVSTLPREKAAKGFNLLHGCFAIGGLLAPLLLVAVTSRLPDNGWRVMAGFIAVLCAVQYVVYLTMPIPDITNEKKGVKGVDYSFLKNYSYWFGTAMLFFYISTEYAIVGWLVTYFQDSGLLNDNVAQLMNSLFWLIMFIGRMLGAYIIGRRISRERLLVIDGIGVCAFFMLMFFSRSTVPIVIGLVGVAFFMSTIYTSAFSFGSECVRGNDLGCGLMIFFGSVGGILTPLFVGLIAEKNGISAGMGLVAAYTAFLLASILLSVTLKRRNEK